MVENGYMGRSTRVTIMTEVLTAWGVRIAENPRGDYALDGTPPYIMGSNTLYSSEVGIAVVSANFIVRSVDPEDLARLAATTWGGADHVIREELRGILPEGVVQEDHTFSHGEVQLVHSALLRWWLRGKLAAAMLKGDVEDHTEILTSIHGMFLGTEPEKWGAHELPSGLTLTRP